MKTWFAFLIVLPLVVAVPARAATPQPIVFSESTPNVTLDTPGLHDLATAAPGTTITVAVFILSRSFVECPERRLLAQTLNKKFITSPSFTTYSLPSARILPASLAPCSPLQAIKSS